MNDWEPGQSYEQAMLWILDQTLTKAKGNKTKAAKMLKLSVRTVRDWISKYDELARFRGQTTNDRYPDY
jgi:transcriptional regulator with PAS, ATPase and Fis domain